MTPGLVQDAVTQAGDLLRDMLGGGIAVAALDPRRDHGPLLPEEAPAVAQAVPRRQREFAAGRAAARQALALLGATALPVRQGPDRAPIWPDGYTGSISHCGDCCLAAVARIPVIRSIGVDIEPAEGLEAELSDLICTPREASWLGAHPASARPVLARLIFSAKEAAYKAQYPLTGQFLDFGHIGIDADLQRHTLSALFTQPAGPFRAGDRLHGSFRMAAGFLITAFILHDEHVD